MKKILFSLALTFIIAFNSEANSSFIKENVQRFDWDGVEVVWLKDDRFPTFHMSVYFADGSLNDRKGKEGETNAFFELLSMGTSRYGQKDIADVFDFYGVDFGHNVVAEYSQYQLSGMMKFFLPSAKLFCHLMEESNFSHEELLLYKKRSIDSLQNLITNHGQIAEHLARQVFFVNTPAFYPTVGTMASIEKLTSNDLKDKKKYFNSEVKKRIYLVGPKEVLKLSSIIKDECHWKSSAKYQRTTDVHFKTASKNQGVLYFVPVKGANQAQIKMGKVLTGNDLKLSPDLMAFTSAFLGSGFNSRLFQELRVKRGYTYGASSAAANHKTYGRVAISTFSKNETVIDSIKVTEKTLKDVVDGKIATDHLALSKKFVVGNSILSLEESSDFLDKLMYLDHVGIPYEELYRFSDKIKSYTEKDLSSMASKLFNPSSLDLFVLGNPNLESQLKKLGRKMVKIRYQDYL